MRSADVLVHKKLINLIFPDTLKKLLNNNRAVKIKKNDGMTTGIIAYNFTGEIKRNREPELIPI